MNMDAFNLKALYRRGLVGVGVGVGVGVDVGVGVGVGVGVYQSSLPPRSRSQKIY